MEKLTEKIEYNCIAITESIFGMLAAFTTNTQTHTSQQMAVLFLRPAGKNNSLSSVQNKFCVRGYILGIKYGKVIVEYLRRRKATFLCWFCFAENKDIIEYHLTQKTVLLGF